MAGFVGGDVPGVFEGTVLQNAKTKVDHRKRTCSERKPPAGTWQSLAWRQRNEITSALGNDSARNDKERHHGKANVFDLPMGARRCRSLMSSWNI
jgi:hypothetical protein